MPSALPFTFSSAAAGFFNQSQLLADFNLNLSQDIFVLFQERLGVLPALPDAVALVAEPGAGFLDDALGYEPNQSGRLRGRCPRHT